MKQEGDLAASLGQHLTGAIRQRFDAENTMGEIMATIDLNGDWGTLTIQQNSTQVTAIATVANPHFKRGDGVLVGDVLQMTFTGGQYVQTYTGKVSSNGREIAWSNGTTWRR